jgi:molybdopterin-guanine dinucleotide biosynthesis protein A
MIAGFAVAGGHSRRMTRDKALLAWGATDLLGHALARLRAVCPDVRILSGSEARYPDRGVPVIPDAVTGAGALGGVLTGLEAGPDVGLFLAIDLPFVPASFLAHLVTLAGEADAVVPLSPRGPEPLCAVYGPACLEPVRRSVREGRLKMTAFWSEVRVRQVTPTEIAAFGDPERLFSNLNAPEDYDAALRGR